MIKSHLINELVDGPLPLEKDLVEAAERAGIRHVASIWDRHDDSSSHLERLYRSLSLCVTCETAIFWTYTVTSLISLIELKFLPRLLHSLPWWIQHCLYNYSLFPYAGYNLHTFPLMQSYRINSWLPPVVAIFLFSKNDRIAGRQSAESTALSPFSSHKLHGVPFSHPRLEIW